MKYFGKTVVKARYLILIIALALALPSLWGMLHTRVNYDLLTYLPDSIETMKGQDILMEDFGTGAISMLVVEGHSDKEIVAIKERIRNVEHVKNVLWYDSFADITIPKEMLPDKLLKAFVNGDCTLMAVLYDSTTSSDDTMDAITQIRKILDEGCYLQGMSAIVTDTRDLAEAEEPIYVAMAVILAVVVLTLAMDSFLIPVFFLLSIGLAILYNMGTNYFFGEVSYITKALAAVLQLGVTMDYSIFLWHSFKEQKQHCPDDSKAAMADAIDMTLQSVVGSSVTTIAGFAALCFMTFRFGMDVGLVMMKGVALGVVSCVTILPAMILLFEKLIVKTSHRPLLPSFRRLPAFIARHYRAVIVLFILLWIPAVYGYNRTEVFYDILGTLPDDLDSVVAGKKLHDTFEMDNTLMILADSELDHVKASEMCDEMRDVPGVKSVIALDAFLGGGIPKEMLPPDVTGELMAGGHQLMLVNSEYATASEEINRQIDTLGGIIHRYDESAMLIGDAPCTKDLITISNHDFTTVNWASIGIIFVIILLVFKSVSLPFLLVLTIEFAIFVNLAIPYFTGVSLPFIASIVIGPVQLGSTVDYAILMSSRDSSERTAGAGRTKAVEIAHRTSIQSVFVSAMTFFAATFGVGLYSRISMISSLCALMARGALISMIVVLTVLPAILILFDPLILRTTFGMKEAVRKKDRESRSAEHAVV